jgi:hypothetical protein
MQLELRCPKSIEHCEGELQSSKLEIVRLKRLLAGKDEVIADMVERQKSFVSLVDVSENWKEGLETSE